MFVVPADKLGRHPVDIVHSRREIRIDPISYLCSAQFVRKIIPVATPSADLTQPPKMTIFLKPLINKDIAFRTRFGLGPDGSENQGPNREFKTKIWEKSDAQRMDPIDVKDVQTL